MRQTPHRALPGAVLAAALAALGGAPGRAADLPVRAVTLSTAGLAQITRSGELAAGDPAGFVAPTELVDDLLKSLSVADPAGTVVGLRLPARDLAAEAFRGLPLRAEDFQSRAALLNALRGQEVEAAGATGRIAEATETDRGLRLALITGTGLVSVTLADGAEARLTDAALAGRVARAALAVATARTEDERRIEVLLRADRARTVALTYVAGAPVWKPSWRLTLPAGEGEGRAHLQGWAVVENLSGSDWDAVRLALVSGEPNAFRQPLYEPVRVERPVLPVRVAEAVNAQADTGARPAPPPPPMPAPMAAMAAPAAPGAAARGRIGQAPGGAAAELAAPSDSAAPALAAASAGRVSFALPEPVTLRGGETANLPFLDARLPAQRVWWVQDLSARHPLQAVRIANDTGSTLPDGLATIFGGAGAEAGGYLGEAEIRALPPGDSRLLAFARDRDVLMTRGGGTAERAERVELQRGRVVLHLVRVEEVSLAIDARGARGRLVVDLPRRPGATPRFAVAAEGDFGLRHETALEPGATTLRLPFERAVRQEQPLWDAGLGDPVLVAWRQIDVERELRRLPGGPGTLETLREVLNRMAPDAPGRAALAGVVEELGRLRQSLDAFRVARNAAIAADLALDRARRAVEDRSGPAREQAREGLNRASVEAERTGRAADEAWQSWRQRVVALLAREA